MTESPQQPGYNAAQQQQAAAYAAQQQQQQAYAAQQQQQYAQPAPNVFDKLPMNMLTIGLAGGGLVALLLGVLLGELKNASILTHGSSILSASVALMVVTAVAITTGPKFRNTYRAITVAFAFLAVGSIVGSMLDDGSLESADVVVKIGASLVLIALCLFSAATFTMAEPQPVDPNKLAAMQAAQAHQAAQQQQQQAAQQQAAQQQAAQQQQQYAANPGVQQPTSEQPTTWQQQQQPPQQ